MESILVNDIYLAAFVVVHCGSYKIQWDEYGLKANFLLSADNLEATMNLYSLGGVRNVNARALITEYKKLAKELKETKPVNS